MKKSLLLTIGWAAGVLTVFIVLWTRVAAWNGSDLERRQGLAKIARYLYPAYSTCGRCNMPWGVVRGHSTIVVEAKETHGWGVFPLCEECWIVLRYPDERMKYYRELWESHHADMETAEEKAEHEAEWPLIERAVLEGK